MVTRCNATTTSGAPCSAQPVREDGFCYWHSPALAADREEARRRGGAARSNRVRAKRQLIDAALSPAEIEGYIALSLRGVLASSLTPGVANAVANLARAAVAVREAGTREQRNVELEAAAGLTGDHRRFG